MLAMLKKSIEHTQASEQLRMTEALLSIQSERFAEIAAHIDEIKLMRHDMRHHLHTISGLLSEKLYSEAEEYLRAYAGTAEPMEEPLCSCHAVDVIVRLYRSKAESADIQTEIRLGLSEKPGVAETDLCIVLGNLMENAINACLEADGERRLSVIAKTEGSEILIAVDNTCRAENPVSSRESSGLGIPSVQAIANKYGGMARFERKGARFMASVLLYKND
jgi:sensor histidine kinase regulating citrate/malate metabolism